MALRLDGRAAMSLAHESTRYRPTRNVSIGVARVSPARRGLSLSGSVQRATLGLTHGCVMFA